MKRSYRLTTLAAALAASFFVSTPLHAVPINYGDFVGTNVTYIDVTEDSGTDATPLFGAPTVSGNSIDFSPPSFNAFASGAGGNDTTDGTLTFMLQAMNGHYIASIDFSEAGDTTLTGFSGDAYSSVTATVFVDIFEVDNTPISQINVPGANMVFTPSAGDYQLSTDGGGGPAYNTIWTGSLMIDLDQALIDAGQLFKNGATKVTVTLDNKLVALSQDGTSAFIAKKDFDGLSVTPEIPDVPEPASVLLLLMGLGIVGLGRPRC